MSTTCYLALGSNLGDRSAHLHKAIELLNAHTNIEVTQQASFLETEPELDTKQSRFLNTAIEIQTHLSAEALLDVCQGIEEELGRVRNPERPKGPRTLDIDIIFYGQQVITTHRLQVPHPAWQDRDFVKQPLSELIQVPSKVSCYNTNTLQRTIPQLETR